MTAIDLDRINAEAREIHPGRALLSGVASVLYAVGWLARKSLLAAGWCAACIRLGWRDAAPQRPAQGR